MYYFPKRRVLRYFAVTSIILYAGMKLFSSSTEEDEGVPGRQHYGSNPTTERARRRYSRGRGLPTPALTDVWDTHPEDEGVPGRQYSRSTTEQPGRRYSRGRGLPNPAATHVWDTHPEVDRQYGEAMEMIVQRRAREGVEGAAAGPQQARTEERRGVTYCADFRSVTPGSWSREESHNGRKGKYVYTPRNCVLPPRMTEKEATSCLLRRNITRIGILGDSHNWRYAAALRKYLPKGRTVATEHVRQRDTPDPVYMKKGANLTGTVKATQERRCASCRSVVSEHGPITLDEMVLTLTKDTSVSYHGEEGSAGTTQEFIARLWWRPPRTPDLVLYMSTVQHDIKLHNITAFLDNVDWALPMWSRTLHAYKPDMVFVPWVNHLYKDPRPSHLANHWVRRHNEVWRRRVDERAQQLNLVPGADLQAMTEEVPDSMYLDGAHMTSTWYDTVVGHIFFPIFCETWRWVPTNDPVNTDRDVFS